MAEKVVAVTIQANASEAISSVKSFKAQLREAEQDVLKLSERFGATSKEAQNAAKRAAELRDTIGDSKSLIDAFNPDQKFRALSQSLNGVLGGFTALTGAMGLLGVESEDTQKMLLKVQSAMALSQGLNQVGDAIQSFKNLGTVIQSTTIFQKANNAATVMATTVQRAFGASVIGTGTAFKVLKGVIAATGIGLLVVGLAAAADALGVFSSNTDDAAESQSELSDQIERVNSGLQAQTRFLNRQQKWEVAYAKSKGANAKQLFEIEQKYRDMNIENLQANYAKLQGIDEEAAAKSLADLKDAQNDKKVAELEFQGRSRGGGGRSSGGGVKEKKLSAADQFALDSKKALAEEQAELERREFVHSLEAKHIENTAIAELDNQRFMQSAALQEAQTLSDKNNSEARAKYAELEAQTKIKAAYSVGNTLNILSDLVGKETAAGKVLAIASATINTYLAASEALKANYGVGPFAQVARIAAVVSTIALGLKQVKEIVKVKVPGASGGSVPSFSSASMTSAVKPQAAQSTRTTLDQNQLNQIGNATVRAFVVESDVSNSQERIRRLNRAARL